MINYALHFLSDQSPENLFVPYVATDFLRISISVLCDICYTYSLYHGLVVWSGST